jgi:hypothetical protein
VWVKDSYKLRSRGVLPLKTSIWVVPGPISVQINAPGYQPFYMPEPDGGTLIIKEGERKSIAANPSKVTLVEIAPLPSGGLSRDEQGSGGSRWLGWSLAGVGAAALVGGIVYGARGEGGCGDIPATAACHEPRRNPWAGWGVAAGGLALGAFGGFLVYRDHNVEVSMALGPGTFGIGGRL